MNSFPKSISVIWQMRIAGMLILLSVLIWMMTGAAGLRRIELTQLQLTDKAIPALARVEAFDDRLRHLGDNLGELRDAAPGSYQGDVIDRVDKLINGLKILAVGDPVLLNEISKLEAVAKQVARMHRRRTDARKRVLRLLDQIQEIETAVLAQIDLMLIENGTRLDMQLLDSGPDIAVDRIRSSVSQFNALTRLSLLLNSSEEMLETLRDTVDPLALERIEAELRFTSRTIVRHLSELSESKNREDIARGIARARNLLVSEQGLFAALDLFAQDNARFLELVAEEAHQLSEVETRVNTGVAGAKIRIADVTSAVKLTISQMTLLLLLVGVAAIALMLVIGYFLLEKRVIRRLGQLTLAVRDIAAGDTARQVDVTGDDELGEMALALERFKENSKELQRSNTELARFAYAASHDLRSPLRAIHDLAEWTLEDAGDALPPDCRENLEMLLTRAQRLTRLLNDLLSYSQIGRESASYGEVNLTRMISEIVELQGRQADFQVEITGDATRFDTYATPLEQICLNLIGNAIKHHDKDKGKIRIDCNWSSNGVDISITDDGPGIPAEYHERVFAMFETLRPRDEVEGSGMGLAIIRKLVEQYGSRVDIISDPLQKRGTTFHFEWPATRPETHKTATGENTKSEP